LWRPSLEPALSEHEAQNKFARVLIQRDGDLRLLRKLVEAWRQNGDKHFSCRATD
jgi:hypothetical protein